MNKFFVFDTFTQKIKAVCQNQQEALEKCSVNDVIFDDCRDLFYACMDNISYCSEGLRDDPPENQETLKEKLEEIKYFIKCIEEHPYLGGKNEH